MDASGWSLENDKAKVYFFVRDLDYGSSAIYSPESQFQCFVYQS